MATRIDVRVAFYCQAMAKNRWLARQWGADLFWLPEGNLKAGPLHFVGA